MHNAHVWKCLQIITKLHERKIIIKENEFQYVPWHDEVYKIMDIANWNWINFKLQLAALDIDLNMPCMIIMRPIDSAQPLCTIEKSLWSNNENRRRFHFPFGSNQKSKSIPNCKKRATNLIRSLIIIIIDCCLFCCCCFSAYAIFIWRL